MDCGYEQIFISYTPKTHTRTDARTHGRTSTHPTHPHIHTKALCGAGFGPQRGAQDFVFVAGRCELRARPVRCGPGCGPGYVKICRANAGSTFSARARLNACTIERVRRIYAVHACMTACVHACVHATRCRAWLHVFMHVCMRLDAVHDSMCSYMCACN